MEPIVYALVNLLAVLCLFTLCCLAGVIAVASFRALLFVTTQWYAAKQALAADAERQDPRHTPRGEGN